MKSTITLFGLLMVSLIATSQTPLVGTWELISVKATNPDGTKVAMDQSGFREIKVISPTHYMMMTHGVSGDSLVFDKAIAGTIKISGNKFVETPLYASADSLLKAKTDYTWKVQGDKFTQSGTVTFPYGGKLVIEELVFQRVSSDAPFVKNVSNGTWDQLSSGFEFEDGRKDYHTKMGATRFQIITPSHVARLNIRDGKFEGSFVYNYTIEGGAMVPQIFASSVKWDPMDQTKAYIEQEVSGDILYFTGRQVTGEGKEVLKWQDVFMRIGK
jgi:hypothetical protein